MLCGRVSPLSILLDRVWIDQLADPNTWTTVLALAVPSFIDQTSSFDGPSRAGLTAPNSACRLPLLLEYTAET